MVAPWYTDLRKQANVLDRVMVSLISKPTFREDLVAVQEKVWSKFDTYMLRRSV